MTVDEAKSLGVGKGDVVLIISGPYQGRWGTIQGLSSRGHFPVLVDGVEGRYEFFAPEELAPKYRA